MSGFDDAPHPISEMEEEITRLKKALKDQYNNSKYWFNRATGLLEEGRAKDAKIAELEGRIKELEGKPAPDLGFV